MDENLATVWEALADRLPEADVIVQGSERRTWRAFDDRAARIAADLSGAGIGNGDKVAIDLFNSIAYLEVLFAALKLGAVPVNVNYSYRAVELRHVLADSGARVIVFDSSVSAAVAEVQPTLPGLTVLRSVGPDPAPMDAEVIDLEVALARSNPMGRRPRPATAELIIYTGGTTGLPKGAVWRHGDLLEFIVVPNFTIRGAPVPRDARSLADTVAALRDSGSRTVGIAAPPLMHGTGFMSSMHWMLVGGVVTLLENRAFQASEVWELVERERATHVTIVGDVFARRLLAELDAAAERGRTYDLSSLQRITNSGAILTPEVRAQLLAYGRFEIFDGIASTEGGPYALSIVGPNDDLTRSSFVLGPQADLIQDPAAPLIDGRPSGLLAYSGPMPIGYHNDPERSATAWRIIDGKRWAIPGDRALLNEDGTLTFLGRDARVVNTGGEKVFCEEVEAVLGGHPAVSDVVVMGAPDPMWGQRLVALVAARTAVTEDELREHVRAVLSRFKAPRTIIFVDEIRHTASGKIDLRWAAETATTVSH